MDLSQKILHIIIKHQLIKSSGTVVVGVSGGADSVALLHVLYRLRHRLGIKLHVAHFNHRLRPGADKDEAFVKTLAVQMNLPITISRRRKMGDRHVSVPISEDQARQWRFKFLGRLLINLMLNV